MKDICDLQSLHIADFDFRFDCGYSKPTVHITIDELVKATLCVFSPLQSVATTVSLQQLFATPKLFTKLRHKLRHGHLM